MSRAVRPIGQAGRLERIVRWAVGVPMVVVHYVIQRVPLYRRGHDQQSVTQASLPDFDRDVPGDSDTLQRVGDGVGPLFHRRYRISVTDENLDAEALIDHILDDLNRFAPSRMARFETLDDRPVGAVDVGDELVVRLPGPWDGPVRIIERTPTSFRLATLRGHMEAGELQFSTRYDDRGFLQFEIESWARSGDPWFHLLYERFVLGREMQMHMWSHFCRQVAKASGGVTVSNVTSTTRRLT